MGFNSVAVILNDQLHEIGRDEGFGARVEQAVSTFGLERHYGRAAGRAGGGLKVISLAHADWPQVCVVYGNTGWSIGDDDIPPAAVEAVAAALRRKGYRVTKPKPKAST